MQDRHRLGAEDREELIALRRDFHRHPELSYRETRTASKVAEFLKTLGLEPRTGVGKTGVTAVMGQGGPVLGLRADMDALPIQEVPGRDYGSEHEGLMHACGHDGHTATLLAALKQLSREELPGTVKAFFQPAEEGDRGARAMIADGALEDPRPDLMLALHYWSGLPTGKLGITPGPVMASADDFKLRIIGKGGHAAAPQETVDPILCASELVSSLQSVVSRELDPLKPAVVTVAEFHAGTAFNIIPQDARLTGTVRCLDPEIFDEIPGRIERVIAGISAAHGCRYELEYNRNYRLTRNDPEITARVRRVAAEMLGEDALVEEISMGSEDMSDFFAEVPGCFVFVGSGSEEKGITAPHHHPEFDLDEDALEIGTTLLAELARRLLASP